MKKEEKEKLIKKHNMRIDKQMDDNHYAINKFYRKTFIESIIAGCSIYGITNFDFPKTVVEGVFVTSLVAISAAAVTGAITNLVQFNNFQKWNAELAEKRYYDDQIEFYDEEEKDKTLNK